MCTHTKAGDISSDPDCNKCLSECVGILKKIKLGASASLSSIDYYSQDCIDKALLNPWFVGFEEALSMISNIPKERTRVSFIMAEDESGLYPAVRVDGSVYAIPKHEGVLV